MLNLLIKPEAVTRSREHLVEVQDEGKGMPADKLAAAGASGAAGVGLRSMRERVKGFGGELEITSDGRGTLVRAVIPFRGSEAVSND